MQNNITKEIDFNRKNNTAGVPFINLLLKIMDASNLATLINGMYKTAKDGFSFSIFQEIFDLAKIESTVYSVTFEQLVEIQPTPSIVYLKEQKCFAILNEIKQNEITLLSGNNNTLIYDKFKFQQTWDGILLPIAKGSFSEISTIRTTTSSYQFDKNNYLEIIAIPQKSHSKSALIRIGQLSMSAYINESYFCFEAMIPACKTMTLTIKLKNKTNKEESIISKYDIPISLDKSINILRFHFAKTNRQNGFNVIGLRGSVNRIYKSIQ